MLAEYFNFQKINSKINQIKKKRDHFSPRRYIVGYEDVGLWEGNCDGLETIGGALGFMEGWVLGKLLGCEKVGTKKGEVVGKKEWLVWRTQ